MPGRLPRVVSLVPSHTETLVALGADVIGITRWCVRPPDLLGAAAVVGSPVVVGGTKDPDVGAIVDLEPDVVVLNEEENRIQDRDALLARGVRVLETFPRTVRAGVDTVLMLGDAAGVESEARVQHAGLVADLEALEGEAPPWAPALVSVFCPVWRRPWVVGNADTYLHDALRVVGLRNVSAGEHDRWAQVALVDVAAARPDVALLPDEPYPFGSRHHEELASLRAVVVGCDGQDLHWYGPRSVEGLRRVRRTVADALRTRAE